MRNEYYRSLCFLPSEYDKLSQVIPTELVNQCIDRVIFGDVGSFYTSGQCIAIRVSNDPKSSDYKKVILAVRL